MSEKVHSTGVVIRFEGCSDEEVARERLRRLQQLITDHYDGMIKLFANEDESFDEDNISFNGAIGIRTDQYEPARYPENPARHGQDHPHPWQLALEVITDINFHVDGVNVVYLKYLRGAAPTDADLTDSKSMDPAVLTEPVTVWAEVPHSQFDERPDWIDTGLRTAAVYRVGAATYDPCEYGGEDPNTTIEVVTSELLEQALFNLLPDAILGGRAHDEILVQLRIPRSLTQRMDNGNEWKASIRKSSQAGNWGAPGVSVQVLPESGLGFRTPKEIYKSHDEIGAHN